MSHVLLTSDWGRSSKTVLPVDCLCGKSTSRSKHIPLDFRSNNTMKIVVISVFLILAGLRVVGGDDQSAEPGAWYRDWLLSQDNPLVEGRIQELGRRLSFNRTGQVDETHRGWFRKFLHERVVTKLQAEARTPQAKGQEFPKIYVH